MHFEIRLFYVRISPCVTEAVPDHLTLRHLRSEHGVALEINGLRVPDLNPANVTLKRERLDKNSLEVTYVSTDSVRITGRVEFEVLEKEDVILCGSLERMDDNLANGVVGLDNDLGSGTGWSIDCYMANLMDSADSSAFFQPKLGVSSPSIEVYIAGCYAGVPLILTRTIQLSPRRKVSKQNMLDAIPEDEEIGKGQKIGNDLFSCRSSQVTFWLFYDLYFLCRLLQIVQTIDCLIVYNRVIEKYLENSSSRIIYSVALAKTSPH